MLMTGSASPSPTMMRVRESTTLTTCGREGLKLNMIKFSFLDFFREFKPREVNEGANNGNNKAAENDDKTKDAGDQTPNNDEIETIEDKFKRANRKSTKSNRSLTLPLDPLKRKDSGASSCDLSKVNYQRRL